MSISQEHAVAIRCSNIRLERRQQFVLSVEALSILQNHSTAIVGLNGSGKTTLLRIMAGLLFGYSGEVELCSESVSNLLPTERARLVAVMPQKLEASFDIPVVQYLRLGLYARDRKAVLGHREHDSITACLDRCGALHLSRHFVGELSGGELKRVLLAAALVQGAPVIMLDEPLAGLDPRASEEITELISEIRRSRASTLLIVTHDLFTVGRIADRVVALNGGRVCWEGTPVELLNQAVLSGIYGGAVALARQL